LAKPANISLPGILQTQGFGDEITAYTKFIAALPRDMRWYLLPQYKPYTVPGNVQVPYLSQPVRHYLGVAWYQRDINVPAEWAGKRIELLREIVPQMRRLSALANVAGSGFQRETASIRTAAAALNIEANILELRTAEDIAPALARLKGRADALYVLSEPLVNSNKAQILQAVTQERIPTIFGFREFVDAGGLMSYGANFPDLFSRAAEFVDKILRGARPADIPVQQPVKFDLIVNLEAAKALGLKIPESFLLRADEVIE